MIKTPVRVNLGGWIADADDKVLMIIPAYVSREKADHIAHCINSHQRVKTLLEMAQCPNCDGYGTIPHQVSDRQYVTRDMALDAGDPSLEGSLYSDEEWEDEQCQWCDERNQLLAEEKQCTTQDSKNQKD